MESPQVGAAPERPGALYEYGVIGTEGATIAPKSLDERLAYLIATANRQIESEIEARLRPGGVPIEQFRILEVLNENEPCPMGEIARRSFIDPATLTKIVDRMVRDNLVYRAPDPGDRRRVLVMTAAEGKALFKRLNGVSSAQEQRLEKILPQDKVDELEELLKEIIAN